MPEFFVWFSEFLIEIIDAETAQDAAEQFLNLPVTVAPEAGVRPDCFVQLKESRVVPRMDGRVIEFWATADDRLLP